MSGQLNAIFCSSGKSVLVVIPCLNEEKHIEHVITRLAAEADRVDLRVVIADGGSTDQTCQIVQRLTCLNPHVLLMHNPKRTQAAGINAAVRRYGKGAECLIRADAHASYPSRFCEKLLQVQARTQADSVVVSMRAVGSTCFQRAAAAAQNSILGNGGSAHRNETTGRWVEHGHHALMTIKAFNAAGGYDETFSHNEDAELDNRLTANGSHIFLTGEVQITYYPRGSVAALFRQYFNIGHGRARNFLKHRKSAKLRHFGLAPIAPAVCLVVLTPISPIFAAPALTWGSLCIGYGIILGARLRDTCGTAAGLAATAMQAGWSFGFFAGIFSELLRHGVQGQCWTPDTTNVKAHDNDGTIPGA
jgi:succinoglycan biosynthesis protein ExoA